MATLNVTTNFADYRGTVFSEPITTIVFAGAYSAVANFNASQFGGNGVSNTLIVQAPLNPDTGSGTYFTITSFYIAVDNPAGGTFDARGWNFRALPEKTSVLTIAGTNFNDTIHGSSGSDQIYLERGSDTADGAAGRDYIYTVADGLPDSIDGGGGIDYVDMRSNETASLRINLSDGGRGRDIGNGTTLNRVETGYYGLGSGNDVFTGGTYNDTCSGGAGNDRIDGGDGTDSLIGGDGDDVIISSNVGGSSGLLAGGNGIDTLILDRSLGGVTAILDITLSYVSPTGLVISNDFEILRFKGGFNADTIAAGNLADRLDGGGGDDSLSGRSGRDVLIGGAGNDILTGGNNADTLTGGLDADTFVFDGKGTALKGAQADLITDFEQGVDHIDITGVPGLTFIGTGAAGAHNAELGYRQTATQTIITVRVDADDNGVNEIDYEIRLNGVLNLTSDDFVL